jgi:CBS domain-containing protein
MKVREIMVKRPAFCLPDTTISVATETMWKCGCGFLPVVGEGGNVIGVLTDRDISIALGTRNVRPSQLRVKNVMTRRLFSCTPDDDVHAALATMRIQALRRLPVLDAEGALVGVLSIDDLARKAHQPTLRGDISYEDIEETHKAISRQERAPSGGREAA